ncbi:conserved phage C-terminal domain-containing protein [Buttiauxella izardii]|uniref:Phage conserved hypothetical protein C-terminal domain-containing protein n=1 Tax=Buttiauxella izardii TaxID=82991 RepID=A0A3A5JXP1_9ENTR|nr:conserved phage C-terminal domain-containing protein [Buttiauxella izardii]RJT26895.1 hypothetical protein D6029_03665 [Buttiauxella izardii]
MTTSSRIFDVVQAMSGQKNVIIIPRPYLQFFGEDQQAYQLAAVLNQLVFWSGCGGRDDGWFYKTHEELGEEVELGRDQIRRIVTKLESKYLAGVLDTANRRLNNGDKVKHYRLDGDKLIELIFPVKKDACPPNGNGESAEPEQQNRHSETADVPFDGNGEGAVPILYTDLNTDPNLQIIKPSCQPASPADGEEFIAKRLTREATEVVEHLSKLTGVTFELSDNNLQHIRARLRNATATKDEMLVVVDHLVACWLGTKFARGLNPSKIFSSEKFSSNLLAAKAWDTAGRPACSSEPATASNDSLIDVTERDAAYRRYMSGTISQTKPSDLELRVCKAAGAANLRKQNSTFAISRWNSIWKEQAQRGNQGAAA